jgi:hypothetical protein
MLAVALTATLLVEWAADSSAARHRTLNMLFDVLIACITLRL